MSLRASIRASERPGVSFGAKRCVAGCRRIQSRALAPVTAWGKRRRAKTTWRYMGKLIGYARTSTADQSAGLEAQMRDLEAAGCVRIFREQVSSVGERAEMDRALAYLRGGDTLVVCKVDRLAQYGRPMGDRGTA
jgi:predicted site-specific integrase-resolvase